jgi:16S rRNA (adenine1518-N6/adenine1519-N6)-dimethyltransferase
MIDARALLREANLFPKRSFGQNFLVAERVVRGIAEACVPDAEVGRAAEAGNFTLLEADAQAVDIGAILRTERGSPLAQAAPRVLCGNLPYQITGRLLELAVRSAGEVDRVVFMVQDEVAERLVASPGTKEYGALTVFVRASFDVKRLFKVSPGAFHPPPEITSSVIRLTPVLTRTEETDSFRALVRGAFGTRRKTLRNAWRGVAADETIAKVAAEARVSLDARGETLSVEDFARAAAALDRAKGNP